MKPLILFSSLFIALFLTLGCHKDEVNQTKDPQSKILYKTLYTSDFEVKEIFVLRDGNYSPFMSAISLVRYDVFTAKLYVYNIAKIDSVVYERISTSIHVYAGVSFMPYKTAIFYKDGSNESFESLSPNYLGPKSTIIPYIFDNQLDNSNIEKWVTIDRTNLRSLEYDEHCGSNKWKWFYDVETYSGSRRNYQIKGLCNLSLNYKLIF